MKITTIGIDLAKDVLQVHGVDSKGKAVLRKQMRRGEMTKFFVNLPPCLIGMEACGSAHYWARKLSEYGHTVKLMAPQFVKPYVKTNKHDMADAEAQSFVKARTAQANQMRGLLAEFGIIIPKGIHSISERMPLILEDAENGLPGMMRNLLARLNDHFKVLDQQVDELEAQIKHWHKESELSRKLEAIPGIGPITASAIVATVGNAAEFRNGRQLAAWFGLVPKQHSSGGKQNLLGISKRGDVYLRTLLIHGARSVLRFAEAKAAPDSWLRKLMARRNNNVAAVALANKNARIIWALLAKGATFHPNHAKAAYAATA